ncbi:MULTISPECIES: hypothetical protein [Pseudomonas]|jgi:hypothetical protein|uniref:Uncharacterized protein n=1 Tax=Pseudomonas putida TaxID=303 RepID=A0A8I1EDY9_PSEPU|nr:MULTISPECIES: hypothetical protein [Pseudomonas]MBI6883504.1 hypothetical protein [Pseudomonas putida]
MMISAMNNEHDGLEKLMRRILLNHLFAHFKGIAALKRGASQRAQQ